MQQRAVLFGLAWILSTGAVLLALADDQAPPKDQSTTLPSGLRESLDGEVLRRLRSAEIIGIGAAIIVDRSIVWKAAYGFADREASIPFSTDTVLNVGSISKTFVGASLMKAAEQGRLNLDQNINAYLPFPVINPHFPKEPITLRHLATHTSGITDRWEVYEASYHDGRDSPVPLGQFLADYFTPGAQHYSNGNFLEVRPGAHRDYSNIAAALAGYVAEVTTGQRLDAYTQKHLFTPLGMNHTGWFLAEMDRTNHATLYERVDGKIVPIELYGLTTYPDGGVRTSISDLAKFFVALLDEGQYDQARILETSSAREMLRFQYTESRSPENVAPDEKNSGIFWSTKRNVTRVGHGGSDPGVRADMFSDLSRRFGVILFTNTGLDNAAEREYLTLYDRLWDIAESQQMEKDLGRR